MGIVEQERYFKVEPAREYFLSDWEHLPRPPDWDSGSNEKSDIVMALMVDMRRDVLVGALNKKKREAGIEKRHTQGRI